MGFSKVQFVLFKVFFVGLLFVIVSCNKKQTSEVVAQEVKEQLNEENEIPISTSEVKEVVESEESITETTSSTPSNNKEEDVNAIEDKTKTEVTAKVSKTTSSSKGYKLEVGQSFPAFELTDINGKVYSSEELKGKVKVFNFWFTACKPCRDEIPELNMLVKQFEYRDDVVFIAPSFESKAKIEAFTAEHPFEYGLIDNVLKFNQSVGVKSYPVHLIIDKEEKVHTIVTQRYPTIKDIMANYIYNAIEGRSNETKYEG